MSSWEGGNRISTPVEVPFDFSDRHVGATCSERPDLDSEVVVEAAEPRLGDLIVSVRASQWTDVGGGLDLVPLKGGSGGGLELCDGNDMSWRPVLGQEFLESPIGPAFGQLA